MNDKNKWLCPHCKYGHLFRVVKNAQHIPTHSEYICVDLPSGSNDLLSAPKVPGSWDGKSCSNFINKQTINEESHKIEIDEMQGDTILTPYITPYKITIRGKKIEPVEKTY